MMLFHLASLALAAAVGSTPNTVVQSDMKVDIRTVVDTDSVLTMAKIEKMKTFWTLYAKRQTPFMPQACYHVVIK